MLAKDVEGWPLEAAVLLFAQKLPGRGPTGTPPIAEKAAVVLAAYRAVRGVTMAGATLMCTLLEQEVCPEMAESTGTDEDTSSLMGGRATWKTVLGDPEVALLVSTKAGGWAGFITRSSADAGTTLARGPKETAGDTGLPSASPGRTCRGWCGALTGSTSITALPKLLSTLRLLLGPEPFPLSSRDSSERTEGGRSGTSAPPRSDLCTALSTRMGATCEAAGSSCGGRARGPAGLEPASFCTGRTWAVGLAELEGK